MTHKNYQEAVEAIHYWQYGHNPDNFYSLLLLLFQKADYENRKKLARAFIDLWLAYEEWNESPSTDDFFEKYGLKPSYRYRRKDDE